MELKEAELRFANDAIRGVKTLTLNCAHCGRQESFKAHDRFDAVGQAILRGWHRRSGKELCKRCL